MEQWVLEVAGPAEGRQYQYPTRDKLAMSPESGRAPGAQAAEVVENHASHRAAPGTIVTVLADAVTMKEQCECAGKRKRQLCEAGVKRLAWLPEKVRGRHARRPLQTPARRSFKPGVDFEMEILIVDDEPAIADTLAYALSTNGYASERCGLGLEAVAMARGKDYALIVLDVGLPDISGFDVCRELRRTSNVPIIFLTAHSEEVDRIVGLELGADDYVAKPFSPRELVSRVRAILRRAHPGGNHAAAAHAAETAPSPPASPFQIDRDGMRIGCNGQWLTLTRYEYLLLACLLERPGRVMSRAALMDQVWTHAEETEERTVDTHIKTLRAKLRAVLPERDPIVTHRGLGYSIDP
jgi:two-component system catabolic regulation response regulator CreB